ncbi:hypothetical protein [Kribbia dieselivorans]|uniref:hypothetical protein n=1 Tax=Kribbia dieselivorans TaxID=331526 RepID=UPI000839A837|nr:hypothetical protein [Kribbia dieselivorans]
MSEPIDPADAEGVIRWKITELTSLARQVDPVMARPGLYVIHFANGDAWVGRTVDLPHSFSAMRRRWPEDIEAIEYVPALVHEMAHAQDTIVTALRGHGSRVRNVLLDGLAASPVLFDRTVDPVAQVGWLLGEMVLLDPADRAALSAHRSAGDDYGTDQVLAYGRLAESETFPHVFLAAATFVDVALPAADQTEERWWSLAVLPESAVGPTQPRLVSVRVGGTEVFGLSAVSTSVGPRADGDLFLAAGTQVPRALADRVEPVVLDGGDAGPTEALRLPVESSDEAVLLLLEEPDVLLGVRLLVLDLMRRGSGALRHDHNTPMADALFDYMEAASGEEDDGSN